MKNIYRYFIVFLSFIWVKSSFAVDALDSDDLKQGIIPSPSTITYDGNELEWYGILDYILGFLRDSMFALMALIAIAMFLFIWGRLVVARGNPEEFKKAMMSFVYAAVGIFVVAFAWAIVQLVAWINI